MESGFEVAQHNNLPKIDYFMLSSFFIENKNFTSTEIKGLKNMQATRKSYGENAIGFVQLKRCQNTFTCTVKAKVTPEHKLRTAAYSVVVVVDEQKEEILSACCNDCAASAGGCKHVIAFLFWMLRRSEDPSTTSQTCYWKKSALAQLDKDDFEIDTLQKTDVSLQCSANDFLNLVQQHCNENISIASAYINETSAFKKIGIHYLVIMYKKSVTVADRNADDFILFCKDKMSPEVCKQVQKETEHQSDAPLWYELRYGRITASKIYEASVCHTLGGSLFDQITGSVSFIETPAIRRGKLLEKPVLQEIKKNKKIKIHTSGLILNKEWPIFGASPDGISDEYVIEIKCPFSDKTVSNYYKDNVVQKKYLSQIQLQMYFANKKKGLFVIADTKFEENKKINIIEIDFDQQFVEELLKQSEIYWKTSIYPLLIKPQ